jgi:hypothetical protein
MTDHLDTMSNKAMNRRMGLTQTPAQRLEADLARADAINRSLDRFARRLKHVVAAVAATMGVMAVCDEVARATQEARSGVTAHTLAEQILGREIRK